MKLAIFSTQIIDTNPDLDRYGGLELVTGLLAKYIDEETEHTLYLFATEDSYAPKKSDSFLFSVDKAGKVDEITALKRYWGDERSRNALLESDICLDVSWSYALYHPDIYPKLKNVMKMHHGPTPGFNIPPPYPKPCFATVGFQLARKFTEETGLEWRAIHNGIDISKYTYNDKKENYLVWLGRLYPFKGAHRFISICNRLEIQGYVVGRSFGDDINYVNMIKDMCEKSKYVEYLGEVSLKKKVELLKDAKALIQPSVYRLPSNKQGEYAYFPEPFGITTIEAMACGTPSVVSPIYGWVETLIHGLNGFHAVSDDEFIYYIKRIDEIKPENCRKMAEHFDYHRMGKEYIKMFEEIKEGRRW